MLRNNCGKTGVFLLFLLLTATCYGQTLQNVQWNVPYYDQLTYLNWGQSACGPTSITGLLKYWFPNSTIDIPEVYHGATQAHTYNGPLYWYRNVGWALNTGDYWSGTTPDTGYNRTAIPIPSASPNIQQYYSGTYSGMSIDNAVSYLQNTWGGTAQPFFGQALSQLLQALQNGPVLAGVDEGYGGHIVLVTGYQKDTQNNEWVSFNEPYYPYSSLSATKSSNYPNDVKNRTVSRSTFNTWYTNRSTVFYITFALPAYYGQASDSAPSDVRQNTIIVDNSSYYLDEVLAVGASVALITNFHVDNDQGLTASGQYVWRLYHQSGKDYAYATEAGHSVRWTPSPMGTGYYIVKVRSHKRPDSGSAYYSVKWVNGQEVGGATIDQHATTSTPFESTIGLFWLAAGSYVEVANMPANTAADTVVFEYVSPNCQIVVQHSIQSLGQLARANSKYEASDILARLSADNDWATGNSCPVLPPPGELYTTSLYNDANLFAYYRMEGNGNDSKSTNNGTPVNVTFSTGNGKFGQGAGLNGSNSIINTGFYFGNASGNYGNTTLSAWIKLGTTSQDSVIAGGFAGFFWGQYGRGLRYTNGTLYGVGQANSNKASLTAALTDTSSWHHVVVVNAVAGSLWIDGVKLAAGDISDSWQYGFNIGQTQDGNNGKPFNGNIDDVAVFTRALTDAEIGNLYNGGGSTPATGTVNVTVSGYSGNISCTLNGSNVTAPTTLGNQAAGSYTLSCTPPSGHTLSSVSPSVSQTLSGGGTITFAVTVSLSSGPSELYTTSLYSDSSLLSYWRMEGNSTDNKGHYNGIDSSITYGSSYGKFGQGSSFNGSTSRITTGYTFGNSTGNFGNSTVSAWVKLGATSQDAVIAGGFAASFWGQYGRGLRYTNGNLYGVGQAAGNKSMLSAPLTDTSSWHHVVVVNAAAGSLWIDGVKVATGDISDSWQYGFVIGGSQDSTITKPFNGYIDDVALFTRALTDAEVTSLYNGGSAPSTGTVTVSVSGYSSNISCTLNGGNITAPITINSEPTGSYTLACTAPIGYTISSILPSATQNLSAGGTITFAVTLTSVPAGPPELYTTSLYNDANLFAYYRMEGNAVDSKGSNNGTAANITFSTGNGKFGQGAGFNGSTSNISGPFYFGNSSGNYGNTTLSTWIKLGTTSQDSVIAGGFAGFFWGQYGRGLRYTNGTLYGVGQANSNKASLTAALTDTSSWHHVVVVNAAAGSLWIDGVKVATGDISDSWQYAFTIGQTQDGNNGKPFNGNIDDVAVFTRALTDAEITSLYGGGLPTSGTTNVAVSGYSGNVNCTLNGMGLTAPGTMSNLAPGSYALACTAPSGYTVSSISPSATQNVVAGQTTTFTVNLTQNSQPSMTVTPTQTSASLPLGTNSGTLVSANISYANIPVNSTLAMTISGLPTGVTAGTTSQVVSGNGSIGFSDTVNISTSAQPGTYYPVANITVASLSQNVNLTLQITVPTLSVQSCTASPSTVWPGQGGEVGQSIVFSVPTPTGGTPPYNYSWTGSFTSSLQTQAIFPSQFGTTYTGNLTVTDSGTGGNQQSRQVSCSAQTYVATTAPQNVSMTISPSNPTAGQVVTITLSGVGFYSNTQVQLFGGLCGSNGCTASNVANSVSITGMQALAQLNNSATFTVYVGNNSGMLSYVGSFTVN